MMQANSHYLIELYEQRALALRSEADNDRLAAAARCGDDDCPAQRGRSARRRLFGWPRP